MERSLSILLPVRDDQSTLAALVQRLLDVLTDLPSRFELIVVDDGSTDATIEVADELAALYPQISAVRHAQPLGQDAAIQSGLAHSGGDIVLVYDRCGLRRIERHASRDRHRHSAKLPLRANSQASRHQPQRPKYLTRLENLTFEE